MGRARANADTWTRGHRLCLAVRLRPIAAVVAGHPLDVGSHQGLVRGSGRHWLPLVLFRRGLGGEVACGFGVRVLGCVE